MSMPAPPEWDDEHCEAEDDPGLDIDVLRRRRELLFTGLALVFVLAAAVGSGFWFLRTRPPSASDLVGIAQRAVSEAPVVSGMILEFAGQSETQTKQIGEWEYEVASRFVAVAKDGNRTLYFTFRCSLTTDEGRVWRPRTLVITPQY
jgi:hypothetical protein